MGLVLSCDCTPLSHEGASNPVWEHTVALVRYTLEQDACARHLSFEPNEEVMLCPTIFLATCQNLSVQPEVDYSPVIVNTNYLGTTLLIRTGTTQKANGKLRMVLDNRPINRLTVVDK